MKHLIRKRFQFLVSIVVQEVRWNFTHEGSVRSNEGGASALASGAVSVGAHGANRWPLCWSLQVVLFPSWEEQVRFHFRFLLCAFGVSSQVFGFMQPAFVSLPVIILWLLRGVAYGVCCFDYYFTVIIWEKVR